MRPDDPPSVSCVVVTWNSRADIAACLASITAARDECKGGLETIVVDNGSRDGTREFIADRFPDVELIPTHRNFGYGAAANIGMSQARGEVLLVINPDAALEPGALRALVRRLERDPTAGCVAPVALNGHAKPTSPARSFPSIGVAIADGTLLERWLRRSHVFRHYYRDDAPWPARPDWVDGACLCLRRAAIEAVGGFDAGYFMYAEELDLISALHAAGWTCELERRARIRHIGSASADLDLVKREQNFFRSRYRHAAKTWGRPFAVSLRVFVGLTDLARLALEIGKLARSTGRTARRAEIDRIARVTLWQWFGWRR